MTFLIAMQSFIVHGFHMRCVVNLYRKSIEKSNREKQQNWWCERTKHFTHTHTHIYIYAYTHVLVKFTRETISGKTETENWYVAMN